MTHDLVIILAAGLSSCGFALMYSVRPRYMPYVLIGGGLSWAAYLAATALQPSRLVSMFAGAAAVSLYTEICARLLHVPAPVLYVPSILPLMPGAGLYYFMRAIEVGDIAARSRYGSLLAQDTLGIVLGSVIALSAVSILSTGRQRMRRKRPDQ